jgi:RHS repeat-associated protein
LDGLGRTIVDNSEQYSVIKQTTTTVYNGDRTTTIPPQGAIIQATATDALGRTTELDQYTVAPTVTKPANTFTGRWTVSGGTSQATLTKYNHRGQASDLIDPAGNDWKTTYNLVGQVISKQDPDAGTSSTTYDPAGNVTSTTDADGHTTSYVYDSLGRKTAAYDATVDAQAAANELASWTYDGPASSFEVGQQLSSTAYVGGSGGTAYTEATTGYNVFGESLGTTVTIPTTTSASQDTAGQSTAVTTAGSASLAGTYTFSHQYSATTGLPSRDVYPAAGGLPAEGPGYSYTGALDLPSGLGQYASSTTYDAYSRVIGETLNYSPNFAYITNNYDDHTGQLTDTHVDRTATPTRVDDEAYTYDPAGNVTSQTDTRNNNTSETRCYNYDLLDRLTQAWTATDQCAAAPTTSGSSPNVGDAIPGGAYWTSWTFDALGQRTNETDHAVTGDGDTSTNYTYNGNNTGQPNTLTSSSTSSPTGTSTSTFAYDKTGNTTARTLPTGAQTLTWSSTGQLGTDTNGATATSYVYDAGGNQLLRQDGATTTLFLPNEQLVLNSTTGAVTGTRFIPLPGGGQAVRTGSGNTYSYEIASDKHGTNTLSLDYTGQNATWRQFTPYGAPRGTTSSNWPDQNGFLDKPTDATTGLVSIGAREYDTILGRFISLDPKLDPSNPGSLNGYTYTDDNPVNQSDPTGQMTVGVGCPDRDCHPDGLPAGESLDPFAYNNPGHQRWVQQERRTEVKNQIASLEADIERLKELEYRAWLEQTIKQGYTVAGMYAEGGIAGTGLAFGDMDWKTLLVAAGILVGAAACMAPGVDAFCAVAGDILTTGATPMLDALMAGGSAGATGALAGATVTIGIEDFIKVDQAAIDEESSSLVSMCTRNSFAGSTPVLMADGTNKPIDQVQVGDHVEDAAPDGLFRQHHRVTAIHVTYTDRAFDDITIGAAGGTATLTSTAYHLFWDVTTKRWTQADDLRVGDQLQTLSGDVQVVANRHRADTLRTYNLTVDDVHTYYVLAGSIPVLVHNGDFACPTGGGTIFSHFTDAGGVQGIAGVDVSGMSVGDSISVGSLHFGQGDNNYLAENPGDMFATDLGADATTGQLNSIGVYNSRQEYVIQFSQEAAMDNGIRPKMSPGKSSIYTFPGGSTLGDGYVYTVTRVR